MRAKLGVSGDVQPLLKDLLAVLHSNHVDFTSFFHRLAGAARGDAEPARSLFLDLAGIDAWIERWRALGPDADAMERVNPVYLPRNHLVEEALLRLACRERCIPRTRAIGRHCIRQGRSVC